jgi:RHS repeat-associated protein
MSSAYRPQATGSSGQPFRYTGELWDGGTGEPNLLYLRARYYEPGTGLFVHRDPSVADPSRPVRLNPFIDAGNSPMKHGDHSGRCTDPGGPGIRYCIDRFIPQEYLYVGIGDIQFRVGGDARGPEAYGSRASGYRVRQLVFQRDDETTVMTQSQGVSTGGGLRIQREVTLCGAAVTSGRERGNRAGARWRICLAWPYLRH